MSTDRDFLQLVDDRVQVWSPTKKKFYARETIKDEFGIDSKNFIILKCITGDGSDNIPGIRGAGTKSLQKRLVNRCFITGRAAGYNRFFRLSRLQLREKASKLSFVKKI